jgi:hypothetical protein
MYPFVLVVLVGILGNSSDGGELFESSWCSLQHLDDPHMFLETALQRPASHTTIM